jgi:CheY-like chemotaxis protein
VVRSSLDGEMLKLEKSVLINASISHELRTPLNAIIGYAGTLLMKLPGPINADQERQLRIIQSSARDLLSRINGLMEVSGALSGGASCLEPNVAESLQAPPPKESVRRARVLIIEDDLASRTLLAYLVTTFGYVPLIAEDGEQGLAMARAEMPDLILCDVQLSNCDGYEVARDLKHDPVVRHIPLVAVTAIAPIDDDHPFPMGRFDFVLSKPIRAERLAAQLQSFLAGNANLLDLSKIDGKT